VAPDVPSPQKQPLTKQKLKAATRKYKNAKVEKQYLKLNNDLQHFLLNNKANLSGVDAAILKIRE
jgi:hypothetical protein